MKRSWIDALVHWATTRRIPWWLLAAGVLGLELLLLSAAGWSDGSLPVGQVYERYADLFYAMFGVVGYGFLVGRARRAFTQFRPALGPPDADSEAVARQLTSLSPRVAWLATAAGAILGAVAFVGDSQTWNQLSGSIHNTIVIAIVAYGMSTVFMSVLIALMGQQLRMVVSLHRRAPRIDLFHSAPAHSFARLTSAIGTLVIAQAVYGVATDPNTFVNPVWRWLTVAALVFSVAVFFLPLRGMQRRLQAERRRLLEECTTRIRGVSSDLHAEIDGGRYESVAQLRGVLDALDSDRGRIRAASTWPWEAATLRGFVTTLGVPIVVWLVTRVLGESLGL